MGPKRRGRKRRKRRRKLGKGVTHVDRELYEISIRTLTERIERRDALIEQLKALRYEYETKYDQEAKERNATIDSLNREIQVKRYELEIIEDEYVQVEKLRQMEHEKRQNETHLITSGFEKLIAELQQEQQSLSQNVADFEEFKLRKNEIEVHIASMENDLIQRTKQYENELKKLEKLYFVDHDRLRKEMTKRSEEAAETCRQFSEGQMRYTVRRAIKETVRMGVQLKAVKETIAKLTEENVELKVFNNAIRNEMKLSRNCCGEMQIRFQPQVRELKRLREYCKRNENSDAIFEKLKAETTEFTELAEKQERQISHLDNKSSLFSADVKRLVTEELEDEARLEEKTNIVGALSAVIQECDRFIKHSIIEIPNSEKEQVEYLGRRQMLMSQLLEMMEKVIETGKTHYADLLLAQSGPQFPLLLDQWIVDQPPLQYQEGDLGLLPKYESSIPKHTDDSTIADEVVTTTPPTEKRSDVPDLSPRCKTFLSKMGMLSKFANLTETIKSFQ